MDRLWERSVLNALSKNYFSIYSFNLRDNTLKAIKVHPSLDLGEKDNSGAQNKLHTVMKRFAVEEDRDLVTNFIEFSTLNNRFLDNDVISITFKNKIVGWCKASFIRMDDDYSNVLFTVENIDRDKDTEKQIRYFTQTDLMTGLLNRVSGEKEIKTLLRNKKTGLFCLLNIDRFKNVREKYGYEIGDEILNKIAAAIGCLKTEEDVAMRIAGDEMAVYFLGLDETGRADELIKELLHLINEIHIEPMNEHISVSLGAVIARDGMSYDEIYQMADRGVYNSKIRKESSYDFML